MLLILVVIFLSIEMFVDQVSWRSLGTVGSGLFVGHPVRSDKTIGTTMEGATQSLRHTQGNLRNSVIATTATPENLLETHKTRLLSQVLKFFCCRCTEFNNREETNRLTAGLTTAHSLRWRSGQADTVGLACVSMIGRADVWRIKPALPVATSVALCDLSTPQTPKIEGPICPLQFT